ncbi:glycosyl transferase family 1 [Siccirubricoccus deserti]|uniref:Glycosyltransferase n=1 Tax=Siccirubricoccus deserti TaxID=2013562 RepID=A0A9X0UCU6_9PROT|nr:glycosyltransferase family 4 protein [Siccirubricoccus deserti]MBC4014891.1 glycosyltransferase [Siccirubricoccus deserti]GGC37284.1 glycosyl transferase family 1 [Siccirubricoccus deserti]
MSHAAPLLLHVFPGFGVGGAQVRFAALANRFGPRWRHAILALDGNTACTERLRPEVPCTLVPLPHARDATPAQRLLAIRRLFHRLRPALLVTSNWGSIEWAIANLLPPRLPHLHTEDGFGPDEAAGQKPRRMLARRLALRRSEVVVPSTLLLDAARQGWRLPEARLHHIPNGLDLRRFRPDGPPAPLQVPGEGPLIGTVAALRPEKNLGRLLRAMALLRAEGLVARLAILGDGPERRGLEALTGQLGLGGCVRFLGHVPDPAAAYRGMDLLALSSDTEQMPFSVLEAMASGLAVAATEVGDLRAMLPAEGWPHLAAREDAALAVALRPLLADAALRARLGAANRAKAERDYDEEVMYQAYARLFDGLARG